jgi:manganese/iron transport system permease protein
MMDWAIFEHAYLQRALLAGFCAGVSCSIVGVFVVTMHLSFMGVCIAHAAFAGALLGLWLEINPMLGALVFSLATAALIGPLSDRGELSPDTSIGILFSFMLGLGFLFMGMMPGARTAALNLLWGKILTVTQEDLFFLALNTVMVVGVLLLFFKEIQAVLCHRAVALAVGIPATLVFYGMLFLTGVTITVSLPCIGGLLVYCLVLNPAAAAFQLTFSLPKMFLLAALFGVLSCWLGLAASYLWDLMAGASIILASTLIFALATLFSPKRKVMSCPNPTAAK